MPPSDSDHVVVVDYDPSRTERFEEEQNKLMQIFSGTGASIVHVGSTAIPNLGGKPVVDIVIGIKSLDDVKDRLERLEETGYCYMPEQEKNIPDRRFFRKPATGERLVHLHCVLQDSNFYRDHIEFRDYLRSNAAAAQEYFQLKKRLADEHGQDRNAYTNAKTDFITQSLAKARGTEGI